MSKFHHCAYWNTWSRRLSSNHLGSCVEVDLTPINPFSSEPWDETKQVRIRKHNTSPNREDLDTDQLPPEARSRMVKMMGEEVTEYLITTDFMSLIDWEKYDKFCNGGAFLKDIRKS